MTIPLPVLLVFFVLLGWPLVQIVKVLVLRPRRRRLKDLAAAIKRNPAYGTAERAVVDVVVKESRGSALNPLMPILMPIAIIAACVIEVFETKIASHDPGDMEQTKKRLHEGNVRIEKDLFEASHGLSQKSAIWDDPRFAELRDRVTGLEMLSWPISLFFTGLTFVLALPIYALAFGIRFSAIKLFQSLRRFIGLTRHLPASLAAL